VRAEEVKDIVMKMAGLALGALLLILLAACSSIDCPIQNTVYTVYKLRGADGGEAKLADTLHVLGRTAKGDTVLLNRGVGLASFNLPVSYSHEEDTLVFLRTDTVGRRAIDTVWVQKKDIPHFESVDCSAAFFHELTGVRCTHRGIDSIVINNRNVNYDPTTEHFHIYFKTAL
jgi:hypothetical protein